MLMTGEKQLAPVWVRKIPRLTKSLCFPRTSTPAASATWCIRLGLEERKASLEIMQHTLFVTSHLEVSFILSRLTH